jgi:hypothetical protein
MPKICLKTVIYAYSGIGCAIRSNSSTPYLEHTTTLLGRLLERNCPAEREGHL